MLTLQDVTAGYDGNVVLRDIDLCVPEASIVALIGANGAGKTTLLRVASGLLPPSGGRIVVDGTDLTGSRPAALAAAGICHVPEGRGIFPSLTVRENLRLFCPPRHENDGIARAAEAFPRLKERLDQLAGTMSGGEQQMLALSRAYICDPKVVLLDEVSMGLAPVVIDEIFEFISLMSSRGASLLLVEQYVTRVLDIAEYVYLLDRGRIGFCGESAEVLADDGILARYLGTASDR